MFENILDNFIEVLLYMGYSIDHNTLYSDKKHGMKIYISSHIDVSHLLELLDNEFFRNHEKYMKKYYGNQENEEIVVVLYTEKEYIIKSRKEKLRKIL